MDFPEVRPKEASNLDTKAVVFRQLTAATNSASGSQYCFSNDTNRSLSGSQLGARLYCK